MVTFLQKQTESWNGSAWTEVNDLNTGRPSVSGSGSYTSAISSTSWSNVLIQQLEIWNGTIWRKDTDLNTGRDGGIRGSDNTEGITFGGRNPPTVMQTQEEFSAGAVSTKSIDTD